MKGTTLRTGNNVDWNSKKTKENMIKQSLIHLKNNELIKEDHLEKAFATIRLDYLNQELCF